MSPKKYHFSSNIHQLRYQTKYISLQLLIFHPIFFFQKLFLFLTKINSHLTKQDMFTWILVYTNKNTYVCILHIDTQFIHANIQLYSYPKTTYIYVNNLNLVQWLILSMFVTRQTITDTKEVQQTNRKKTDKYSVKNKEESTKECKRDTL